MDAIVGIVSLLICVLLYLLPACVAEFRQHRNTSAIFLLNLFTGWTLLGWIIALVMAVWKERTE